MKTNFLFPNKCRIVGWMVLIPAAVLGCMVLFYEFEFSFLDAKVLSFLPSSGIPGLAQSHFRLCRLDANNLTNELAGILFIIGAILVAFSREKNEDEYISKIRLESLLWATYITCAIQILGMLLFYDFAFLYFMIVNMFTLLILFIARYHFMIYRSKSRSHEE